MTLPVGDTLVAVRIGPVVQAFLRTREGPKAKEVHAVAFMDVQREEKRDELPGKIAAIRATSATPEEFQQKLAADPRGNPHR